jgi:hypothetical protein
LPHLFVLAMPATVHPPLFECTVVQISAKVECLLQRSLLLVGWGRTPDLGDEVMRLPAFALSGVPRNPQSVR